MAKINYKLLCIKVLKQLRKWVDRPHDVRRYLPGISLIKKWYSDNLKYSYDLLKQNKTQTKKWAIEISRNFVEIVQKCKNKKVIDMEKIHVRKKFWPSNFYENKWKIRSQRENILYLPEWQNNLKEQSYIWTRI